jgi:hypothetical protein
LYQGTASAVPIDRKSYPALAAATSPQTAAEAVGKSRRMSGIAKAKP